MMELAMSVTGIYLEEFMVNYEGLCKSDLTSILRASANQKNDDRLQEYTLSKLRAGVIMKVIG